MVGEPRARSRGPSQDIELCAVAAGLKPVARFVRSSVGALERRISAWGLSLVESDLVVAEKALGHVAGGTLVALRERVAAPTGCPSIIYCVRQGDERHAEEVAEAEAGGGTDEEIGRALGYPECCSKAYGRLFAGHDWVGAMLAATDRRARGLVSCNRLVTLFGDWSVLPDYFPCSFACEASHTWGRQIYEALMSAGLQAYAVRAREELARPIRIEARNILRCTIPPQIFEYRSSFVEPRSIDWCW